MEKEHEHVHKLGIYLSIYAQLKFNLFQMLQVKSKSYDTLL